MDLKKLPRKLIGEILIEEGYLEREELKQALITLGAKFGTMRKRELLIGKLLTFLAPPPDTTAAAEPAVKEPVVIATAPSDNPPAAPAADPTI